MSDKLAEIIATKHQEVEALLARAGHLRAAALQRNDFRGFRAALDRGPAEGQARQHLLQVPVRDPGGREKIRRRVSQGGPRKRPAAG